MEQLHQLIKSSKGQLLVEILLAVALTAIMIPALLTGLFASKQGKAQQSQRIQAVALMKEAEEVVRNVREQGWSLFSINGTYHPLISGNSWTLASGSETINGLTREITISDVYRNADGTVAISGGTLDPSTKKVELHVTWGQPYSSSVDSTIFVTRYLQNAAKSDTTVSEFNTGILSDTVVTNTAGGEIALAPNTKGKWCSPSFSSANIALPDGPPVAAAATASANVSIPNDVFVATSPTSANSFKLAHVKVTANTDPPVPTLRGKFTLDPTKYSNASLVPVSPGLDNSFITNAVKYYKSSSGKLYALIATTKPDREVIAILVDDNNPANDNTNDGEYQDYVNGIYKYWTFFDTKIYAGYASSSTNTGFLSPSANVADSGGDGNGYDSNPTRAYSSNSSFAVDTNSGSNTGTNCTGSDKDKHRYYNYGFNIPAGGTIDGIEIRLDAKADSTTGSPQMCVQLSWDGGTTWTTTKSTSTLTTNTATYTLGGSTDTWGRTWSNTNFSDSNFRVRVIDVANNTSRDFSLDWVAAKVYYNSNASDQAPYNAGGSSIAVLDNNGYVTSGGFLYTFDLSNIDSKSQGNGLDMVGCRIELDGYDCNASTSRIRKYTAGNTGTNWGGESAGQASCNDGGNTQIYAENDIYPVKVGSNIYVYAAVGAGTDPELDIANVSSIPSGSSSPAISNSSCGTISSGNSGWKKISSLDFNSNSNTQETANSVYASPDGTRGYISSNGTVDANGDGNPDSWQFYVIDTSNKSAPKFLTGTSSTGATSGYYYGSSANAELYPRRSLTVFNGSRAIIVGKDGISNSNNATEYQVVNISNESAPTFCGSLDFNQGFSDLASVTEADNDKFAYLVSNTGTNELKIIQGGPDGTYLDSGTYESTPQDLGSMVALNRLTVNSAVPANASLKFQVAATAPVSGSCNGASYTYVGPDGQADSYFLATGGPIPLTGISGFQNPAQCVRYKAFLSTTDYNVTPTILDASINYSP